MKPKQIKQGLWKNQIVHFNGIQHKVIDWDGKLTFKIDDEKINLFSTLYERITNKSAKVFVDNIRKYKTL